MVSKISKYKYKAFKLADGGEVPITRGEYKLIRIRLAELVKIEFLSALDEIVEKALEYLLERDLRMDSRFVIKFNFTFSFEDILRILGRWRRDKWKVCPKCGGIFTQALFKPNDEHPYFYLCLNCGEVFKVE